MIERYSDPRIKEIWTDERKLELWQQVELTVIGVREKRGLVPAGVTERISAILKANKPDVAWWKAKDKEISHDLNAFIDERQRHLPLELQQYFHVGLTSYDTEELPFQIRLIESVDHMAGLLDDLETELDELAIRHRETPMLARTHGQWAKIQSFGKRVLCWKSQLVEARTEVERGAEILHASKLSGAVGNYQGMSATLEEAILEEFGFDPFIGATQIVPRIVHAPLAHAVSRLVQAVNNIAIDIRLGGRSGYTIYQEPFGKQQKGSSAMPHKKNTILTEQVAGMARMAKGYSAMLADNIETWEERAIEQSCVERVAWPDIFHVTARTLTVMTKVVSGLQVFPEAMMREIADSNGVYASEEAKDFLKQRGFSHDDAYRIIQLAAFCAIESGVRLDEIIISHELAANGIVPGDDRLLKWNQGLEKIFSGEDQSCQVNRSEFIELFEPGYSLRGEDAIFDELLA